MRSLRDERRGGGRRTSVDEDEAIGGVGCVRDDPCPTALSQMQSGVRLGEGCVALAYTQRSGQHRCTSHGDPSKPNQGSKPLSCHAGTPSPQSLQLKPRANSSTFAPFTSSHRASRERRIPRFRLASRTQRPRRPSATPDRIARGASSEPRAKPLIRTRREQTASTPLPLPPVVLKHRVSSKPSQAKTTLRAARRPKGLDDRLSLQAGDATARGFCGRPSHALRHSGRDKCTGHRGPDVRQPPIPILSPSHPLGVHHRHQLLGEHGLRRHQMIRTRPETRPQRHGHGYDTTRRKIRVEP